jgi:hypothetical protein
MLLHLQKYADVCANDLAHSPSFCLQLLAQVTLASLS